MVKLIAERDGTVANFGRIDGRELVLSRGASSLTAKSQRPTKEI